jgi:nitroreductase
MNAEDLMKIMKERRSIRKYLPDEVPKADIEKIIEAGTWAPSGGNLQNWHFVVITSKDLKEQMLLTIKDKVEKLSEKIKSPTAKKEYTAYSGYYTFFTQAPAVIAVIKKPYNSLIQRVLARYGIDYTSSAGVQGPSAAIENMLLMSHALGYGTCWMTGPMIARIELEELLEVKEPDVLMALIPLGKPEQSQAVPKRKSIAEVVSYK